jgi:FAD/FMN-containing dehydrogenase
VRHDYDGGLGRERDAHDPDTPHLVGEPMSLFGRGYEFVNWSRTLRFRPERLLEPRNEAEVQTIVKQARATRKTVRVKGAGHSFSQLVTTPHDLLSLDALKGIVAQNGNDVTVQAGTRLKDLIPLLKARGLGLRNMGSVTQQSIAGATSTGTHGTGLRYPSMSGAIRALRLVQGDGTVEDVSGSDRDLLGAARLSLGTFGVITELTIECVPYYEVDYDAYVVGFDRALQDLPTLAHENERVLMWWFHLDPLPRDRVIIITKNKAPAPPQGILAGADDLTGGLFDALRNLGNNISYDGIIPLYVTDLTIGLARSLKLNKSASNYVRVLHRRGGYEEMLTIPLLPVYHRECEYAVPFDETQAALRRLDSMLREMDAELRLPVEVRFVGGDSDILSPGNKGDVCYIGASTLDNATEVFERFEPLMKELGGRSHWGKHANVTADEVRSMYPRHAEFVAFRRQRDPDGVFLNTLLRDWFA